MISNQEFANRLVSECENCGYHYKVENEKYPSCHCDLPEGMAPCEQEEYETEDIDE